MPNRVRLCLALHNHQPVGNFDDVIEQAYRDSYLPFFDVFDSYPQLHLSLHISGPLMEWLERHHPEYLERLGDDVRASRIEILGGAFYEPILTMIPPRDRVGQIRWYSDWLESRFGTRIRGMWMPERVWEQTLTGDLARAGILYTALDDFHFQSAGLPSERLFGHYMTEDDGNLVHVFPGSERLRYVIPFADPAESIDYLRQIGQTQQDALVVFADDGEKFGSWPNTKKHVYTDGWLHRFFQALSQNQEWLVTNTLGEAFDAVPAIGTIYLPEGSYREMTEWALPVERQRLLEDLCHELQEDPRWSELKKFMRGGYWRNFKVKYSEAMEMYARMMGVSRRLDEMECQGCDDLLEAARRELYRGQCNCSYWHGAFGGIYLPHLRNATYTHLIAADNLLDQVAGRPEAWIEATTGDFNLDGHAEVRLENKSLICFVAPHAGGQMYELDVRSACHNLLASLMRREEAYHRKVLAGPTSSDSQIASIHDRVVFKQEGLETQLQYDRFPRKSLLDRFYPAQATVQQVAAGTVEVLGHFIDQPFQARIRRKTGRTQVMLAAHHVIDGVCLKLTKGITLEAGNSTLEIAYLLEGLPGGRHFHLGVEFNFAGLPGGTPDRYYVADDHRTLGPLDALLDLNPCPAIGLVDEWLGIELQLHSDAPTGFWCYPVRTVSQSEGGFELVHQSVVVEPHWDVVGDKEGRWSATMRLVTNPPHAERLLEPVRAAATL